MLTQFLLSLFLGFASAECDNPVTIKLNNFKSLTTSFVGSATFGDLEDVDTEKNALKIVPGESDDAFYHMNLQPDYTCFDASDVSRIEMTIETTRVSPSHSVYFEIGLSYLDEKCSVKAGTAWYPVRIEGSSTSKFVLNLEKLPSDIRSRLSGITFTHWTDYVSNEAQYTIRNVQAQACKYSIWTKAPVAKVVVGEENGTEQYACAIQDDDVSLIGRSDLGSSKCLTSPTHSLRDQDDVLWLDSNRQPTWTKATSEAFALGDASSGKVNLCRVEIDNNTHTGYQRNGELCCRVHSDSEDNTCHPNFEYLTFI